MFIGEAPGRLGADQTEIPFHGDQAGHNFEELLRLAGLSRDSLFVTNAVLCNPRDSSGRNSTPNPRELDNCSSFLREQIQLIDPAVVVTLGASALRAASAIEAHNLNLAADVRTAHGWFGRVLIPLYHPGQRAMVHRSAANQRSDYQFVAEHVRRIDRSRKTGSGGATRADVLQIAEYLLAGLGELTYFSLHKLTYLAEYLSVRKSGVRLSKGYFIRQKDGPYCTDLQIQRLKKASPRIEIRKEGPTLLLRLARDMFAHGEPPEALAPETTSILNEVIDRYGARSDSELKAVVYLTAPMRSMLRRERKQINLYNAPIDFLTP
jgi:uracil-DNA glycosylase family 4